MAAITIVSPAFELRLPSVSPLLPLGVLTALGRLSEKAALELIECGRIEWAWDIRRAGAARREIRVWRDSLFDYLARPQQPARGATATALPELWPHSRPALRSTELTGLFCCSSTHIHALARDGLLEALDAPRRGPCGAIRVSRASVEAFLLRRRVA